MQGTIRFGSRLPARPCGVERRLAVGDTERANRHIVAAAADAKRVKRLVQIADKVDEEFQRGSAIGAIKCRVGEPLLVIQDAIDGAVAPAIVTRTGGDARLTRTVAIAVVPGRVRRDVEVVPPRRLHVRVDLAIGPRRHIRERLAIEQPGDILPGDRRQSLRGNQTNKPMPKSAPRLER